MVDYSKWDHFHDSSSEDEDEEDTRPVPHVTRLDKGTRVAFGKEGVTLLEPQQESPQPPQQSAAQKVPTAEEQTEARRRQLTRNGGEESTHLWSQTREEVHIAVFVTKGTRAKDVSVVLVPHASTTAPAPHLTVSVCGKAVVDADVAYPFSDDKDALDSCYELQDFDGERRVCIVELRKEHLLGAADSVVQWWDRALASDRRHGVEDFVDADHTDAGKARKEKWAAAWEEAHRLFREKVKNQQPAVLDP